MRYALLIYDVEERVDRAALPIPDTGCAIEIRPVMQGRLRGA